MKKYSHLYDKSYFTKSRRFKLNPERIAELKKIIKSYNPKSVLDVGCGIGKLLDELNDEGIYAVGCDFGPSLKHDFWHGKPYLIQADVC